MKQFDDVVMGAFDIAHTEALKRKHNQITPWHLLYGLALNPQSKLSQAKDKVKKIVDQKLAAAPTVGGQLTMDDLRIDPKLQEWITLASGQVIQSGEKIIKESDLLRFVERIVPELLNVTFDLKQNEEETPTPNFLINLNQTASQGKLDPVIGRTKEIRAVMEILGRRGKNNPVLVGNAGVGKTAIVEGLALAILKGEVPDILKDKEVYSLDLGQLMAGTKFRGEFEERMQTLLKFIKEKSGQSILFIDEIHQLVGAGRTDGAMDAANLLKPALARGELHCIGATTEDEYQKYILGDAALDRRFRRVSVYEPSIEDATEILMGVREKLEIHHGVKISDEAIFSAVNLTTQYITDKYLPDKAIDVIDEASSALKLSLETMPANLVELEAEIRSKKIYAELNKNPENLKEIDELDKKFKSEKDIWEKEVLSVKKVSELKNKMDQYRFELDQAQRDQQYELASKLKYSLIPELEKQLNECQHDWILSEKNIAEIIARQTGIPVEKILRSKQEQILQAEEFLNNRVFGQEQSIKEICQTLVSSYAGLTDDQRPLGSFLLLGPSGVGKTETAKMLTEFIFGSQNNYVRLDMSEYSEKHSVAKLIGSPAGYVGYEEGGVLTEAVRRKPYAILLFDEIEKAHSDFADILLQILDDGRLTDNKGRTINFRNTIIFLTSNSKNPKLDFKPELLGRLDGILNYKSIDNSVMNKIINKQLKSLNQKLRSKKLEVQLDDSVYSELIERGLDPDFGARPLKTVFNKLITRPLSQQILEGKLPAGILRASAQSGNIEFTTIH